MTALRTLSPTKKELWRKFCLNLSVAYGARPKLRILTTRASKKAFGLGLHVADHGCYKILRFGTGRTDENRITTVNIAEDGFFGGEFLWILVLYNLRLGITTFSLAITE